MVIQNYRKLPALGNNCNEQYFKEDISDIS